MINPPRIDYEGDKVAAQRLKGKALSFYALVCGSMGYALSTQRDKHIGNVLIRVNVVTAANGDKNGVARIYAPIDGVVDLGVSGFLVDNTTNGLLTTSNQGFTGFIKKTPYLAEKVGQWLGSKPECVTWGGLDVFINGKLYRVTGDYGITVWYAFFKDGYLVVIYEWWDTSIHLGYMLFKKTSLKEFDELGGIAINTPIFTDALAFGAVDLNGSSRQVVVNKLATKLVFMGVDGSTPASGFPPECTETPTGIGTGSGKWRSIIRFDIGDITGANELTGAWLTTGVREDFFTSSIYKQVQTGVGAEVSVITSAEVLSSTDPSIEGRTKTTTVNATHSLTLHSNTVQTAVYNPPIKRYVYFDVNDTEQFAVATLSHSYEYDFNKVDEATWDYVQVHDWSVTGIWFPLSFDDTYTQSLTITQTTASGDSENIAFRGHEFNPVYTSLDQTRPFSSAKSESCTATRTGGYSTDVEGTNTAFFSSTGDEVNHLKYHVVNGSIKSELSDFFLGINQYVDDCTMVIEHYQNFINATDTAVSVPTSSATTSIITESIRDVYAIEVPDPVVTTGTHTYNADVSTHTENAVNLGRYGVGYEGVYQRSSEFANVDSSSVYTTTFLYVDGATISDNASFIQPLSDRHGNMLYTINNTMFSPIQTGSKALKAGFIPESEAFQTKIAAEVSIPSDVTGII